MNQLTTDVEITRICGQRDRAISTMAEAIALIEEGQALAAVARGLAAAAANGEIFHLKDRSQDASYRDVFRRLDPETGPVFTAHTDASIWMHVLRASGMENLMDATARGEFFDRLCGDVPPVTEDNIVESLRGLHGDARLIFQRGLARAFSDLDLRFKSHDAFKIGSRMILTRVCDAYGDLSYYGTGRQSIADVERVLAVLDGQAPNPGALLAAVRESRGGGYGPRQGLAETPYLRIRTFKNGNAHLWFTRDDLVEKANLELANYYGEVLPDATPAGAPCPEVSGLPAKNLSYYPTPGPVVDALVRGLYLPDRARVLEPSAGTGNICRKLLAKGWQVDAVEINPEHVAELRQHQGLSVYRGNFLDWPVAPEGSRYDAVIMNPPFYRTHWMNHVKRAYRHLAPGGTLRAVLPATAEVGTSKAHAAFRGWAEARCRHALRFEALPPESFASSGTRVSTVILELMGGEG